MAEIINYATPKGKSEVEEAILQLSEKAEKGNKQATRELDDILYTLERYEDGMPHSRQLRGVFMNCVPEGTESFTFVGRVNWYY